MEFAIGIERRQTKWNSRVRIYTYCCRVNFEYSALYGVDQFRQLDGIRKVQMGTGEAC